MTTSTNYHNEVTNWAFNVFKEKAKFDLSKNYRLQTSTMIRDYIHDCSYAVVINLKPSATMHVQTAQIRLHQSFNDYCVKVLGPQCMDNGKLTSRTRPFLPLIFLAIDVEGSRNNNFNIYTSVPHGHGVIMFDEKTVFNFRKANSRFRRPDGSYEIVNPTREISKIKLIPVCSAKGVERYIHYSLKYAAKLMDNQINLRPFDFYPPKSVNYPFWQYLSGAAWEQFALKTQGDDQDALEWLRNMEYPGDRFRRRLGHSGGGETTPMLPI